MTLAGMARVEERDGALEVVFERQLSHEPEEVWADLTDPKRREQWFVPTELEPRVGGRLVEQHTHVGVELTGEVLAFDAPRAFAYTWTMEGLEGPPDQVRWTLSPRDGGTHLVLRHRLARREGAEAPMAGWHTLLAVLADVLDGADGSDHRPPEGTFDGARFVEARPGTGHWAREPEVREAYAAYLEARG